jgi:hypothetical protein
MRSRTELPALAGALFWIVLIVMRGAAFGAASDEVWPRQLPALDQSKLDTALAQLNAAAATLPPELGPAIDYQKLFLHIASGESPLGYEAEFQKLAATTRTDGVSVGVAQAARACLARAQMEKLGKILHDYYRHNVRFPDTLADVDAQIPKELNRDPWGDDWFYRPEKVPGFVGPGAQRYRIAPRRLPWLVYPQAGTEGPMTPELKWSIAVKEVAGGKALEFRPTKAGASTGVIQPGGHVDDCFLLYIGEKWALLGTGDRLWVASL